MNFTDDTEITENSITTSLHLNVNSLSYMQKSTIEEK